MSWIMWSYKATHGDTRDSWGIYNPRRPLPAIPNIASDSAEEIQSKWAMWSTDGEFELNPNHKANLAMAVPADNAYAAVAGRVLSVQRPGILAGAAHIRILPENLEARLLAKPAHGNLSLEPDGSFTYTPADGFTGDDQFRYRVFDGRLESARVGTVTISVGRND
jgi:hypothetical protein